MVTDGIHDARTDQDRQADEQRGPAEGLSSEQAAARLVHYGPNVVEAEEHSIALELLSHFWGPIPWMIEAALVLTGLTTRWADFGIILALLLLNGGVGFWEEHQAQSAIAALKQRLATRAEVNRNGLWITTDAADLVPGDLVRVGRGEIVPGDGQVVAGECETDESALTGESLPVGKGPGDAMYSGSAVLRGGPVVRVLSTGVSTEFGRTAELAGRRAPVSHFQRAVIRIGKYLIVFAVALVVLIVVVSLLRGVGAANTLEFALVVVIASIPVALPAVLSVTMAVGARYLAKREAVVSHLPAIEELAGVDVLCADKTGTITKNELAVADVVVLGKSDAEAVLVQAALTAEEGGADPVDLAILHSVAQDRLGDWMVTGFVPFDSTRKYAEAYVRRADAAADTGPDHGRREFGVAKGAVQAILDLADADPPTADRVARMTRDFAERGYRALAVAITEDGRWRVSGVLGLQDPPREDSSMTLRQAAHMRVAIKMITGDRSEIAREIARRVGMGDQILPAQEIEQRYGEDAARTIEAADGFAQVVPEDKYRIVQALQHRDHIVAMTGDGVNDAPALRRADAGIAVSGATDAARAASDIVFLSPGFSTIVEAIHRAREVFQRMKNYTIYRITETIRVVVFVTLTILVFAFFPVTPIQVVLLAILNDAAILSIAYDRVRASPRPDRWNLAEVLSVALPLGLFGVVSTFALTWTAHVHLALVDATVQTLIYLKLSVSGHLTVFLARTRGPFWSHRPSWILLGAVIGTQMVATVITLTGFLMTPIDWSLVGLAWGWAAVEFLLLDPVKLATYHFLDRRKASSSAGADALLDV